MTTKCRLFYTQLRYSGLPVNSIRMFSSWSLQLEYRYQSFDMIHTIWYHMEIDMISPYKTKHICFWCEQYIENDDFVFDVAIWWWTCPTSANASALIILPDDPRWAEHNIVLNDQSISQLLIEPYELLGSHKLYRLGDRNHVIWGWFDKKGLFDLNPTVSNRG